MDVYASLPAMGEVERVVEAVAPPATLLELGCGAGRVTRHLVARGYTVVAVDESPEMLEHVRDAETVCARIEELDLGREFDAVLLMSNLLTVEPEQRRAFLEACARHSDLLVVESLPLAWLPESNDRLRIDRVEDGVVHGEVFYDGGASHAFAMRVFADEDELRDALAEGGFVLERRLDARWFTARRARA
ncbi:MAG: class I SAM-dependent methyltransferase [Actinomycetota bacterium]